VITKKAMKTSAGGMFSGSLWTNFSKVDENFDIIGEFLKFSKDRLAVKKNALNQINTALAGATDVSLLINEIDVRKDDLSLSDEEINNCRAFIQNSFSEVSNKEATTVFDDARWNGKIAPKWKKLFLKNAGRIGISTIFSDASGSGLLDKVIELAKINIKNNRSFFNASKDKSPGMIDMLTLEFIKRIKAQPSTDELISLLRGAGVHKFTVNLALPKKTATDLDQITSGFNFLKLSDDLKEMKRNGLHSGLKIENIPEVFGIRDRFMELTNTEGGVLKTEKEIRDRIHSATNISELLIIFDDVRAMSDSSSLTKGLKTYFKTHFGDFEKVENKIEKALKDGNRELVIIDQIHDHFDVQKKLRQLLGKEIDSRFFEGVVNRFDNKNRLTPEQAREEIRQINPDAADINVEFEKLYTILRKLQKVKVSTTLGTTVKYIDSLRIIAKIQAAQQSAKRGARLSLMLGEKGVDEVGIKDMAEKLLEKNFFNRTRRARMDRFPSIEAHTVDFVKDIKATTDIFQLYALLGRQNDGKLLKLKNERAPSKPDFRAMMYEIQQYTMEPDLKKSLKLLPEAYGIKEKVLAFKVDAARTLNEIENLLNALASGAALAVTDRVKIVDSTGTSSNISVFAIKNEIEVYKRTRPKNHALITNDYFGIKTKIINAGF
jgi:Ni,Fe-hydrogenase maturation factor